MRWIRKFGWISSAWRWLAVLAVGLALISVPVASAASTATIMVMAPGAPQGGIVNVQWLDPISNVWLPVTGWTGTLNQMTGSGTPFQAFGVLPANYGQGPFRWVIYNPSSNMAMPNGAMAQPSQLTAWGMSSPFNLPATDGVTLQITVLPMQVLSQANAVVGSNNNTTTTGNTTTNNTTTSTGNTSTTPVTNPSLGLIIASLSCPNGCNSSAITAKFAGLPATSFITVEWLDGNGVWQPVMGWRGQADFTDASGNLVKQFGVYRANYGQGPFRWAVYSAPTGGSLLAVSPNFNLPAADGQNEIMNLAG